MNIALIAAFPVDVQPHKLPQVECRNFFVVADSPEAAYEECAEWAKMAGATEVWGIEVRDLCITPDSKLVHHEDLEQWEHWTRWQLSDENTGWKRLACGPETFRERTDRLFIERNPQFA